MGSLTRTFRGAADQRQPSEDDKLQREAEERAGAAIGDWLMGQNYLRPISALTRQDLARMAAAAIGTWILVRDEQERRPRRADNYLEGG